MSANLGDLGVPHPSDFSQYERVIDSDKYLFHYELPGDATFMESFVAIYQKPLIAFEENEEG